MAITYGEVLAANVRAARVRKELDQQHLADRMRNLGHTAWRRQTVAAVERGQRRLTAEEVMALALALETSVPALLRPSEDDKTVTLLGGQEMSYLWLRRLIGVGVNDGGVTWDGNIPVFTDPSRAPVWPVVVYDQVPGSNVQFGDEPGNPSNIYASKWPPENIRKGDDDK